MCSPWSASNLRKTDCSVLLCGPTGSGRSIISIRLANITSWPTGPMGPFAPLAVMTPSFIGCSVSLSWPTGPDRVTGSSKFMSGIISAEVLVTLKALLPNTGVLFMIYVTKTGLACPVRWGWTSFISVDWSSTSSLFLASSANSKNTSGILSTGTSR